MAVRPDSISSACPKSSLDRLQRAHALQPDAANLAFQTQRHIPQDDVAVEALEVSLDHDVTTRKQLSGVHHDHDECPEPTSTLRFAAACRIIPYRKMASE